ncbi:hypothetical protein K0T92_03210 [Paenibacillus oenotherae]|uniref:Uncharacterized protein n=1 Tax=Paenibacillus oenotherae TaxID=1435645 RepID=A0ABS7D1H0_9BACL|nr:hypothetical protein [Paenibacillus oenotherae]MBW7473752.1 hypothetical protein [Paenibacillus oenotherae]
MILDTKEISRRWVDDHLDLYNFAGQIGDREWQQQIVETMQGLNKYVNEEVRYTITQQLWQRFDSINNRMLNLFSQMKQSTNSEEESSIRELIWKLKLQRIDLARKIKAYCG